MKGRRWFARVVRNFVTLSRLGNDENKFEHSLLKEEPPDRYSDRTALAAQHV
jgi:hypothetical protein